MSIQEITHEKSTRPGSSVSNGQRKRWYTFLYSPLWVCLLVALVVRVWLIVHTHGVIEGDEAMVGIQAENILKGEHPFPIYFYGQPYMGSVEAYLVAILFKIAGPSVWTLRAEPTLLSLVVVWLTWKLAGVLAEAAQLPASARRIFMTTAALLAALPPLYDTVLELRTLGGYAETFVLMLLLLLSTFQLTRRWQAGAARKELALRWAGIGFIVGLGLWVDPLIISAVLAAAMWIVGYCILQIIQVSRQRTTGLGRSIAPILQELALAIVALPACILALLPALRWGMHNNWANVTYFTRISNTQLIDPALRAHYPTRISVLDGMIHLYTLYIAPRVIGGALPTEDALSSILHTSTLLIGLFCVLVTMVLVATSLFKHRQLLVSARRLAALPILFACWTAFIFCVSPSSTAGLISFPNDLAGRYATPLMLALPFFFATTFTVIHMWLYESRGGARAVGRRHPHCTLPGGQVMRGNARLPSLQYARLRVPMLVQMIAFAVLLLCLCAQATSYGLTDPGYTFQSPSCPGAAADNDSIIAYLQHEHVHYAWAISWIGNPIIFKSQGSIITADPRLIISNTSMGRIPAYSSALESAKRPGFLTFVQHNDAYPLLLRVLDARHVTYHARRFPSEPGVDILVVTSLSRTVSLFESKAMDKVFHNCIE